MKPIVSVIIPVYNGEKYLSACLDSVLAQTLREIEIICVDDGSTDSSAGILRDYADRDSRVRIITQANAGAGPARNAGMREANGTYLSILDADDVFEPTMLRRAVDLADAQQLDILIFPSDAFHDDGRREPLESVRRGLVPRTQPFAGRDIPSDAFRMAVGWTWDKLFRRDFITGLGLTFEALGSSNDLTFVFTAIAAAERIRVLDGPPLVHHRTGIRSISSTREKTWNCWYQALSALRGRLEQNGLWERFRKDFLNYCVYFAMWQLTTVRGPAYEKMYLSLQSQWAEELGLRAAVREDFYDKGIWERLQRLLTLSPTDFLLEEYTRVRDSRDQALLQLSSRTYKACHALTRLPAALIRGGRSSGK